LVPPAIAVKGGEQRKDKDEMDSGNGGGGGDGLNLDPLIMALLRKIPSVEEGWPAPKRVRWFRTLAMNVSEIYDVDGDPVELEIKLQGGN